MTPVVSAFSEVEALEQTTIATTNPESPLHYTLIS